MATPKTKKSEVSSDATAELFNRFTDAWVGVFRNPRESEAETRKRAEAKASEEMRFVLSSLVLWINSLSKTERRSLSGEAVDQKIDQLGDAFVEQEESKRAVERLFLELPYR